PVPAVIAPAVEQEQRRPAGLAPVDIMEAQALRKIRVRRRSGRGVGHRLDSSIEPCSQSRASYWYRFDIVSERMTHASQRGAESAADPARVRPAGRNGGDHAQSGG